MSEANEHEAIIKSIKSKLTVEEWEKLQEMYRAKTLADTNEDVCNGATVCATINAGARIASVNFEIVAEELRKILEILAKKEKGGVSEEELMFLFDHLKKDDVKRLIFDDGPISPLNL